MAETIAVEVVLALPDRQLLRQLTLERGATARDALEASGFQRDWPELADPARLGIFARVVAPEHRLDDGDRVEIYRPLTLDPKEARRRRARRPG